MAEAQFSREWRERIVAAVPPPEETLDLIEWEAGLPTGTGTIAGEYDRGGVELHLSGDASELLEALERLRDGFMPDSSSSPAAPDDGDQDEPDSWCRVMPTRRCPAVYGGVCGERPCARYETDSEAPWRSPDEPDTADA